MTKEELIQLLEPVFTIMGDIIYNSKGFFIQGYWKDNPDYCVFYLKECLPQGYGVSIHEGETWVHLHIAPAKSLAYNQKLWLHIGLFVLTLFSTLYAGSMMRGGIFWEKPITLLLGIDFSLTLLIILATHELGHYFASLYNGINASLPYFIPSPHPLIGTFGAFIKIRQPIPDRKTLLQIGAAGPIMSFVTSMIAAIYGLRHSEIIQSHGGAGIKLGDSLIFKGLTLLINGNLPDGYDVMLHPIAYAAWLGFFVTALNLLPIGQLDGGHILYSLFGRRTKWISYTVFALLVIPGTIYWQGWLVWGLLLIIIGLKHPPLQDETEMSLGYKIIAYACLLIAVLCFVPAPFVF